MAIIRISQFVPGRCGSAAITSSSGHDVGTDPLDAFRSEAVGATEPTPVPTPPTDAGRRSTRRVRAAAAAKWLSVIALSAATAGLGVWQYQRRASTQPRHASLTIVTTPPGIEARIRGQVIGKTPVTVSLAAGPYDVELVAARGSRSVKGMLTQGSSVIQHLEVGGVEVAPSVAPGALRVETTPARMMVVVDGRVRGMSPLTIETLDTGPHEIVVRSDRDTHRRMVTIQPGETVSLVISPLESAAISPGWLTVASPVTMQLREDGKLIGTSDTERLMLASGTHEIEIVNDALGYRSVRKISVAPTKTTITRVELPNGKLHINAQPWAAVWVDGVLLGETPLGNLSRPIGPYEVIFRHPELGERRETVVVTAYQPAHLGVDMRGK